MSRNPILRAVLSGGAAALALALWVFVGGPGPRPAGALRAAPRLPPEPPPAERSAVPFEPSILREANAVPDASPQHDVSAGELLVTALDRETLQPVAGATIELRPAAASASLVTFAAERLPSTTDGESVPRATTDAFGVARVALPAGLDLAHLTATRGARTGSAWIDATRRRNVTLELSQRTELVVEVRDRDTGRAVAVPVLVARLAGRTRGAPVERLWASFVVVAFAPSPGHARVVIENSERLFTDARGSGDRRVALLPAVLLMDGGVPVEQVVGREEPITLLAPAFGPVTIRVSDHDGSRFAGRVAVQVPRAFGPRSSWTTEVEVVDGAVRLERVAREGALEVHLRFPDRRDAEVVVARDEGPRAEDTELDVAIADPRTTRTILRGRLVDPAGEPLRSERLVVLETTKRGLVLRSRRPSLVTGDGGEFALALPVSGSGRSVDLYLWKDDARDPLRSRQRATLSAAEGMGAGVHDVGDVRTTLLDEVLGGRVVGEDGAGVPGARVMLSRVRPDGRHHETVSHTITNVEGEFHVYGDPVEGTGRIAVTADDHLPFGGRACAFQTKDLRIELTRSESRLGRLLLPRGVESRSITGFLATRDGRRHVFLSPDGTFEVGPTHDGDHLEFCVANGSSVVHRVRLARREGGEAPDEPLVVDLRGVVFGHRVLVTDADATPVEGAAITVTTEPGIVATTDDDGFAALVCAGPVASVIVRAPGHEDRVASLTTGTNVVRLSSGVNVRLQIRPDLSHLLPEDWRPCLRLERVDPEPPPARTGWSPIEGMRSDCVVPRPGDYAVRLGRFADTDESKSGILALEEPSWTIRVGEGPVEDHELVVNLEQVRAFVAERGIEGDG